MEQQCWNSSVTLQTADNSWQTTNAANSHFSVISVLILSFYYALLIAVFIYGWTLWLWPIMNKCINKCLGLCHHNCESLIFFNLRVRDYNIAQKMSTANTIWITVEKWLHRVQVDYILFNLIRLMYDLTKLRKTWPGYDLNVNHTINSWQMITYTYLILQLLSFLTQLFQLTRHLSCASSFHSTQ